MGNINKVSPRIIWSFVEIGEADYPVKTKIYFSSSQ